MKKLSLLFITLLLLSSCAQDVIEETPQKGKEVVAHFQLSPQAMKVIKWGNGTKSTNEPQTKSIDAATVDETFITDLWIVQFDNSGNFMKKEYFTRINDKKDAFDAPLAANNGTSTSTIYFLANIGPTLSTPDDEAAFKTQVKEGSNNEQDVLINKEGSTTVKSLPMFAVLSPVTVRPSGYMDKIDVKLNHMLAKITFKFDVADGVPINIETIQLCNTTKTLRFVPPATPTTLTSYTVRNFAPEAVTGNKGTFVYYVPENQRLLGTNTGEEKNERLKNGIGTEVKSGTYVQLKGHVTGVNAGDSILIRTYLGADDYNDYNLVRSNAYEVTTTIDGVSKSDTRCILPEHTNCYWVNYNTTFEIPVGRANESDLGVQLPDNCSGWTAFVLWQQGGPSIATVDNSTKAKGYFSVTSKTTEGNALVAIKDDSGNVLWSWHIWVDSSDANNSTVYSADSRAIWMDRNLGAIQPGNNGGDFYNCGGMLYQWGRKDPFIGSNSTTDPVSSYYTTYNAAGAAYDNSTVKIDYPAGVDYIGNDKMSKVVSINNSSLGAQAGLANSLKLATRYPTLFLGNWRGSTAMNLANPNTGYDSWGGGKNQAKTVYDPCPIRWRVPSGSRVNGNGSWYSPWNWNGVTSYVSTTRSSSTYIYTTVNGSAMLMAAAGYRHPNGHIYSAGVVGYYWFANSVNKSSSYTGYFDTANFSRDANSGKDFGCSIRCMKDNY